MYSFQQINHAKILTHSVLVALTPLIPIPILDDVVKNVFLRNMVRQITAARQITLTPAQVEAFIQDNFWDSLIDGCLNLVFYILRELLSKIFFFVEWRRAINLVSTTYYTGFLLDAALLDGYALAGENGSTWPAEWLREAIRRTRYGANVRLFHRLVRQNIRPLAILKAAWPIIRQAVSSFPRLIISLPGILWRGIRSTPTQVASGVVSFGARLKAIPGQIREQFILRVQVLLGKEKAPELKAIERLVQSLQAGLMKMDSQHFDELYANLAKEMQPKPKN